MRLRHEADHCRELTVDEAGALLSQVSPALGGALEKLTAASNDRRKRPQLFLATYDYGQMLMGPRHYADLAGGILPPCGPVPCRQCGELLTACAAARPLYILISGAVEEFLEYPDSVFDPGTERRAAPIRILGVGDVLGGIEFLNDLIAYARRGYRAPVRCATAGARSVFVTMPLRDHELMRRLCGLLPAEVRLALKQPTPSQLADNCHRDNWLFLKLLYQSMVQADFVKPWTTKVIVFANEWKPDPVTRQPDIPAEAKDLLFEVFKAAWAQSSGLRSQFIRQVALADTAVQLPHTILSERVVQHLLSIVRGYFPGFMPISPANELGPFTAVHRYVSQTPLATAPALKGRFPAIIQPATLVARPDTDAFCYFSLSSPTLLGPVACTRSYRQLIESIHDLLLNIRRCNPDLLGHIDWKFFVSEHQPAVPGPSTESALSLQLVESSQQLKEDFHEQLVLSEQLYRLDANAFFSTPPRSGFLSRFVRLSVLQ